MNDLITERAGRRRTLRKAALGVTAALAVAGAVAVLSGWVDVEKAWPLGGDRDLAVSEPAKSMTPTGAPGAVADPSAPSTAEGAPMGGDGEGHPVRPVHLSTVVPDTEHNAPPAVLAATHWNRCALTFDDGPDDVVVRWVLSVLKDEGVTATFFLIARNAERNPDSVREIIGAGHEIGNHSLTHADLRAASPEQRVREMTESTKIFRKLGANPAVFRPPYGRYSRKLIALAHQQGMDTTLWTFDTQDWQAHQAEEIVQAVRERGQVGGVFLMHSTLARTALALPAIIRDLRAKGCAFVTMKQWLREMRELAKPPPDTARVDPPAARVAEHQRKKG